MCPTTRGSRPDERIIDLMDVVEESSSQGGRDLRSGDDADALVLEDVVEEASAGGAVLELTDALDEDGSIGDEEILDLTEMVDDAEPLAGELLSVASAEDISAAGSEPGDEEIDLAELDDLLKDIEAEEDQVAHHKLDALSDRSPEAGDLADIDSLLRELEEDGGNVEADLIPAGLEADSEAGAEPGAATVEYILSGLDDQMDVPPPTELPTMKIAVQPEELSDDELDRMGGLREDNELGQLLADDEAERTAPAGEEALDLGDEAEPGAEEAEQGGAGTSASAADATETARPVIELPSTVPDFTRSPLPEIPVGLSDWDESTVNLEAATAFAAGHTRKDLEREQDGTAEAARAAETEAPAKSEKTAVPQVAEQRLTWRVEALETLIRDELAKMRTLGDRVADVETFVMGAPQPAEWTEVMEAVSALRSAPAVQPVDPREIAALRGRMEDVESSVAALASPILSIDPGEIAALGERLGQVEAALAKPTPSVDPHEISDLRGRLDAVESSLALPAPAAVDPREIEALRERLEALEASASEAPAEPEGARNLVERLKDLEERAGQVSLADVETLREAIWGLEQRLNAQPAQDLESIESRLASLEARPAGLDEEALTPLARRMDGLEGSLLQKPSLSDLAALGERTKSLERQAAELDGLRQQVASVQDGLAPVQDLSSGLAALEERVAALDSRTAEETASDAQELTNRLDELSVRLKSHAADLSGYGERIAALEAGDASQDIDSRLQALAGILDGLETSLAAGQTERLAGLASRLAGLESKLAGQPALPPVAELVSDIADRVEDKVFDRVEIVLSGRMIDHIDRLENSLPEQIEAILDKRPAPAPQPSLDEAALAERMAGKVAERLERQMSAKVEQLLSSRLQTVALELETTLAERLEAPLAERVESALAERFGSDLREKLDEFLEETVMGTLRAELLDEIRRDMPLAAAKIIREEIEALRKHK